MRRVGESAEVGEWRQVRHANKAQSCLAGMGGGVAVSGGGGGQMWLAQSQRGTVMRGTRQHKIH